MTEEKVMALFDKAKERLQKKERRETEEKDEVFLTVVTEKVPRWAEELQEDIVSLKKARILKRERSAELADSGKADKKEAYYNSRQKQKRHTTKDCTALKGKGDTDSNR